MSGSLGSDDAEAILVGDTVTVVPRTWPGINKPGGAARVVKVHGNGTFDLKYIMGGREKNVESCYITCDNLLGTSRKRKSTETFEWSGSPSRKATRSGSEGRSASKQENTEVKRESSENPRSARKVRIERSLENEKHNGVVATPQITARTGLFTSCTKTPITKTDEQREALKILAPSFISPAAVVAAQVAPVLCAQTDFAATMVKGLASAAEDMTRPMDVHRGLGGLGLLASVVLSQPLR
jgi:hypothetical protein